MRRALEREGRGAAAESTAVRCSCESRQRWPAKSGHPESSQKAGPEFIEIEKGSTARAATPSPDTGLFRLLRFVGSVRRRLCGWVPGPGPVLTQAHEIPLANAGYLFEAQTGVPRLLKCRQEVKTGLGCDFDLLLKPVVI